MLRVRLSMPRAEFDALTLPELGALLDALRKADKAELAKEAVRMARFAAFHGATKKSGGALEPADFMGEEDQEEAAARKMEGRVKALRAGLPNASNQPIREGTAESL